jgi:hypothetical protein
MVTSGQDSGKWQQWGAGDQQPAVPAAMAERPSHPAHTSQADLHIHTAFSDGTGTVEEVLAFTQAHTDLAVIAVTDHDTIDGALHARDLVAKGGYGFEVIVGEEITTREGHMLALYLERCVPPGLSIERSIELVHAQGGLAIVAHPFHRLFRFSVQRSVMDRLVRQPELHPDGLETRNGSFAGIGASRVATTLSRRYYHWAETGGSDAHTPGAIGCARTRFTGHRASDVRESLLARTTAPLGGYWSVSDYVAFSRHRIKHGAAPTCTDARPLVESAERGYRRTALRDARPQWRSSAGA